MSRIHTIVRGSWIAAAVIVAVFGLGAGFARLTASPRVCASCHEMQPRVAAWETAPHNQVGCPSCHETPRPWYRFPETLAVRGAMLVRDVKGHWSGDSPGNDTASPSFEATSTIPDSTCIRCHDPARQVTMRYGTIIDHQEHAERNGSCVSCHMWTAHPDPSAEQALLFMQQCFNCHGRSASAKAPGTCDVCHPPSFEKRPESHASSTWQAEHGEAAKTDRQPCAMCHEESFCGDCHGLEMPHPDDWEDGATGHGPVSRADPVLCQRCHEQGLHFCNMCHHEGYEPKAGPWIEQHPPVVAKRGAAACMDCHGPLFCVYCHTPSAVGSGER